MPATGIRTLQRATKLFAIGADLTCGGSAHRIFEGNVNHLSGKAQKVLLVAQRTVDTGGGDLQTLVFNAIDFQCKLQLARDFFAIFHRHELVGQSGHAGHRRLPGPINGDAQQATRRAFNLHQVVAQTRHRLFDYLLQCHVL